VTIFIGNITHYHLEKGNQILRGAWSMGGIAGTAALVKIHILNQRIFTCVVLNWAKVGQQVLHLEKNCLNWATTSFAFG
jgi:hypothetical protein